MNGEVTVQVKVVGSQATSIARAVASAYTNNSRLPFNLNLPGFEDFDHARVIAMNIAPMDAWTQQEIEFSLVLSGG